MTTLVPPRKNTVYAFELAVFDNNGDFLTSATFAAKQISQDGGSYATLTNAPAEIGASGTYTISLTAAEMNCDRAALRFQITGAPDVLANLATVARQLDDLAFPATSGRSLSVDSGGAVLLQTSQPGVTIPTVTSLTNAPTVGDLTTAMIASVAAGVGTGMTLQGYSSARAGYLDTLNTYLNSSVAAIKAIVDLIKGKTDLLPAAPASETSVEAAITAAKVAVLADTALIKAKTANLPSSPAAVGSQMDLVNAPNATAVTAIQNGLATAAQQTTILNRLGAFTGSGLNTVLGFLRALARSDAALTPSDMAGSYDNTADSQQSIRDRGDAAWVTGSGGSAPTASAIADEVQTRTIAAVTTVASVSGAVGSVAGNVGGNVNGNVVGNVQGNINGNLVGNVQGTVPDSAGITSLLARVPDTTALRLAVLAGWTGTLLDALRAIARKDASPNIDLGGTHNPATDSEEALREQLDTLTSNTPVTQNITVNES